MTFDGVTYSSYWQIFYEDIEALFPNKPYVSSLYPKDKLWIVKLTNTSFYIIVMQYGLTYPPINAFNVTQVKDHNGVNFTTVDEFANYLELYK